MRFLIYKPNRKIQREISFCYLFHLWLADANVRSDDLFSSWQISVETFLFRTRHMEQSSKLEDDWQLSFLSQQQQDCDSTNGTF